MRFFFASLATETNTFSPIPTGLADFDCIHAGDPVRGGFACTLEALEQSMEPGDELARGLIAFAQPAGRTVRRAYETLRDELLEDLARAGEIDVVLLLLHGAMVADGYDDCELDLLSRVRARVEPDTVIGVELDLHCHVDGRLTEVADLVLTYKEYPHVDVAERLLALRRHCARASRGEIRPRSAVYDCRMVGLYSTLHSPMRELVAEMKAAEERPGVLAVSFAHGFPWGDVAHAGGKVIAVADADPALARQAAREFGRRIQALRHELGLACLPMEEALSRALASSAHPVVAPDMSDNAGGGAPADSTFVLQWLVEHQAPSAGIAFMYDPEAVRIAKAAGEGARLPLRIGGKTGPSSGWPLDLDVTVGRIREDYVHGFPQADGEPVEFPLGDVAAVSCGGVHVLLASRRCQCFSHQAFVDFGLGGLELYVPKSTNHFMAGFADLAAEVIHMAPPGAIRPDVLRIPYRHMPTGDKYPWVEIED